MAKHHELKSGIVLTLFFTESKFMVQLNLPTGEYCKLSLPEVRELRNTLDSLNRSALSGRSG